MKTNLILCLVLSLVALVALVSPMSQAGLLLWDFEDVEQLSEWKAANGTWEIDDGVLKETSATEVAAHILVGDATWEDYTVEVDIRIDSNRWAGLVFRAISEYEYYVIYPEPTPGVSAFFQHHGDVWDRRARPAPNKTAIKIKDDIEVGEWYHLKIVVEGDDLTWFINDELQAETQLKPA